MYPGKSREAQCDGKVRYNSPGHAGHVLYQVVWRNDLDLYDFSIYPCPHCQHWHFGKTKFIYYEPERSEEAKDKPKKKKEPKPIYLPETDQGQRTLFRKSQRSSRLMMYYEIGY